MSVYVTFSEAELVQLRDELKAELLAIIKGQRYVSLSTFGKAFSRQVRSSDTVKADLGEVEDALRVKNPAIWGQPTNKVYAHFGSYQFK